MSIEFRYLDLGGSTLDYTEAWELQRRVHAEVVAGTAPDTVLLLEHPHTYTAGRRTEPADRPTDGSPVVDVDRGGKITYHGPGQLVAYPIVTLPEGVGVVDFVRRLEEAMIRTFADLGLRTGRVEGRSGVWLAADATAPERKIAAIGIRVSSNVTMHGLAMNVDPDLGWFDKIVPCGLRDVGTTSLARELDEVVSVTTVAHRLTPWLSELLAFAPYEKSPDIERTPALAAADPHGVSYGLTALA